MSECPSTVNTFDLTEFRVDDRRWKRGYLYLFLAGMVALSIELAYFLITKSEQVLHSGLGSTNSLAELGVDLTLMAFILLMGLSLPRYLSGAQSVRLDASGMTLVYGPGSSDRLRWDNPHDRFYIQDFSAYPKLTSRGPAYYLYLPFWGRLGRNRRFAINRELMEALLRKASEEPIVHRTCRGTSLWNGYSPQTHWFEGRRRPS